MGSYHPEKNVILIVPPKLAERSLHLPSRAKGQKSVFEMRRLLDPFFELHPVFWKPTRENLPIRFSLICMHALLVMSFHL